MRLHEGLDGGGVANLAVNPGAGSATDPWHMARVPPAAVAAAVPATSPWPVSRELWPGQQTCGRAGGVDNRGQRQNE